MTDTERESSVSKRGNGEGTVYERVDGRWEAKVTLESGTLKSVYGKTQREALEKLFTLKQAEREGTLVTEKAQKVGPYLRQWLNAKKRYVRPTTFTSYELNVRRLERHLGNKRLDELRAAHIQAAYAKLGETMSGSTVHQAHRTLRMALRQAKKLGLVRRNPLDLVTPPTVERREMAYLKPEQVRTLLAAAQDDRSRALFALLVTTGLRLGEALGLCWEDIDLDAGIGAVRQSVHPEKGKGMVTGPPKTRKSRRPFYLAASVVKALRRLQAQKKDSCLAAGTTWNTRGFVFSTASGKPLSYGSVYRRFHATLAAVGLPIIRPHELRHTAATLVLTSGKNPKVAQEMLGHSSITLTMDTYSHVMPSLHIDVANDMETLFTESE
jgi:integrase